MLRSCKYCNKIHEFNQVCEKKPKKIKKINYIDRFRWSKKWQEKREEIKRRDNFLCQLCLRNAEGTSRQYEYENLSVHHAIPLEKNFEKGLDNDNLITVCSTHHKMCEIKKISYKEVKKIIDEQNSIAY